MSIKPPSPSCSAVIELQPNLPSAHNNLGTALRSLGRLDEAITHYRSALELGSDSALTHSNLGNALLERGDYDAAETHLRRATELAPQHTTAYNGLGTAQMRPRQIRRSGCVVRAGRATQAGLRRGPLEPRVGLVAAGRFDLGWPEYQWGWRTKIPQRVAAQFPQPLWNGRPLEGATILLHSEQGLGDTLQFVRYASLVGSAAAE